MAASKNISNTKLASELELVKYKVDELKKGQDKISSQLEMIKYVPIANYDNDRKEAEKTFATKEELKSVIETLKPFKTVFWGFIGTVITVITTAFLYFVVEGGLR